jgi:UDP-N-acetylglucosamine 1-carboxyvinyltransferase
MLVKMGADIRASASTCCGQRQPELGGCTHDIGPDHIEIGSFIALAA